MGVAKTFDIAFMGLAGTCHQTAAEEMGVRFIAGKVLSAYKDRRIVFDVRCRMVRRHAIQPGGKITHYEVCVLELNPCLIYSCIRLGSMILFL